MNLSLINLTAEQISQIENGLEEFDTAHVKYKLDGEINIGFTDGETGKLIAGVCGCMTVFKIFYISTVFVDENYRGRGILQAARI